MGALFDVLHKALDGRIKHGDAAGWPQQPQRLVQRAEVVLLVLQQQRAVLVAAQIQPRPGRVVPGRAAAVALGPAALAAARTFVDVRQQQHGAIGLRQQGQSSHESPHAAAVDL